MLYSCELDRAMTVVDMCWSQGFPGEMARTAMERGISRSDMQRKLSSGFALPSAAVMIGCFFANPFAPWWQRLNEAIG